MLTHKAAAISPTSSPASEKPTHDREGLANRPCRAATSSSSPVNPTRDLRIPSVTRFASPARFRLTRKRSIFHRLTYASQLLRELWQIDPALRLLESVVVSVCPWANGSGLLVNVVVVSG